MIAKVLGKNEDMAYHKMRRLGLRLEEGGKTGLPPSSSQVLLKEQEQRLIQLIGHGKTVDAIAKGLGMTENAVYMKLQRLGLQVEEESKQNQPSSSTRDLPKELPTIENIMKRLSSALSALEQPSILMSTW